MGRRLHEGADVRLIKGPEAAGESEWIRLIEEHELRSRIVIAHVRKATIGERSYRNAQPFTRELAGRVHLFAHNGYLPGIDASPRLDLEQRLNFGYGCYGCREATDIGPNETVLGFPVTLLPPIFEHLEFLNERAIPASRFKRALAALEQREMPL